MATRRLRLRAHAILKGASKTMSIARIRNVVSSLANCLLIFVPVTCAPRPAFAQTRDLWSQQAQEVQSVSGTSASSDDQASDDQQQPTTQSVMCGVAHPGQCLKDLGHDQVGIWTSPLHIA